MNRRGFLGRLISGGFGLAVGSAVTVEAATANEQALIKAPWVMPPIQRGGVLWITRLEPSMERAWLDAGTPGHFRRGVPGPIICRLAVEFEGPGCVELSQELFKHFVSPWPGTAGPPAS